MNITYLKFTLSWTSHQLFCIVSVLHWVTDLLFSNPESCFRNLSFHLWIICALWLMACMLFIFRYICLLGKSQESEPSCSPLPFVYSLLLSKSIHPSVVNVIIEITDNLLSMPNFEPSADNAAIKVDPCVNYDLDVSGRRRFLFKKIHFFL